MLQDLSQGHYATSNVTSNHSNAADYSVYSDFGSFTKVPNRPPPPKSSSSRKVKSDTSSNVGSTAGSNKVPRRPPHPPKLQHILKGDGKCHDLVKATPRYVISSYSVAIYQQFGCFGKISSFFLNSMYLCNFQEMISNMSSD